MVNIEYNVQKTFDNCISPISNRKLKFDFYIPSKNVLIEFDGPQHFKFDSQFGTHKTTKNEFEKMKLYDKIKTNYSKIKSIKLIRIPYTQLRKIEKILSVNLL